MTAQKIGPAVGDRPGKENREQLHNSIRPPDPLPPRKWQTWITPGHPHERELREDCNLFWRWMPGACPSREWVRPVEQEPEPISMDDVRAEVSRQIAELRRSMPSAEVKRPKPSTLRRLPSKAVSNER